MPKVSIIRFRRKASLQEEYGCGFWHTDTQEMHSVFKAALLATESPV